MSPQPPSPLSLPIDKQRECILHAAQQAGFCLLLSAPTGSGKSTRVPLFLHEAGCSQRGMIVVVQPRRLAARMLAGYVARQWPCKLGEEVGFAVRHESRYRAWTSVLFVTDGVLERWMGRDATLEGVSTLVFDEVHERRLSGDLCLARALQMQGSTRPDLGLVVMSASLELDKLQSYLPQATVIQTEGRLFPVEHSYHRALPRRDARGAMSVPPIWEQVADNIHEAVTQQGEQGDILVFLPGSYEIRRCEESLRGLACLRSWDIFPLHGQLSPEQQDLAVQRGTRPRVILSTNIAETSLTIEGVCLVVDSGLVRESRWEAARGLSSLHLVPISQAQADQRAGRAGRVQAGRCRRLWSEAEHARRAPFPAPEVHRADLSAAFLHLLSWGCVGLEGEHGIRAFPWPEPPEEVAQNQAWHCLHELGAIDERGGISRIGQQMEHYPLPPILARLMVAGKQAGCVAEMAAIAALMGSERVARAEGLSDKLREPDDFSDFQAEWRGVSEAQARRYDTRACTALGISARAAREVAQSYRQLVDARREPDFNSHRRAIAQALIAAMPEHVALLNSHATQTARLLGKKAGKLETNSVARRGDAEMFHVAEIIEIGTRGVEIRLTRATLLEEDQLSLSTRDMARYDSKRKRVINYRQQLYRDELLVREMEQGMPDPAAAAELLAEELIGGKAMPSIWDGHAIQWVNRLHCLREAMPELEMPSFGEEDKKVALSMLCEGASSLKEVEKRSLMPLLREWLSGWQRECLDRYAPRALRLANGREVKLLYREDGTPSFGLKCQLLFGVKETPTIADGRVRCLVEILAPNMRPYQITGDLASFWKSGYAQMKKDLAGRYPRHDWRDDPHPPA